MTPLQLKKIRHNNGLSLDEMAELLGYKSGRSVRYWEDGEKPIPAVTLKLIEIKFK